MPIATSLAWAPSCRSRSILRISAAPRCAVQPGGDQRYAEDHDRRRAVSRVRRRRDRREHPGAEEGDHADADEGGWQHNQQQA
jgi:hypothetical protein